MISKIENAKQQKRPALKELHNGLNALYLELDPSIVVDLRRLVNAAITEAESDKQEVPIGELQVALNESLMLQAHYAELLNMHDGGARMIFRTPEEWIARLRKTGTLGSV